MYLHTNINKLHIHIKKEKKVMSLDPTSPLANNMSKENKDVYFDKYWVAMPHPFHPYEETFAKSFNTIKEVKDYLRSLYGYPYEVFYGRKVLIELHKEQDNNISEDHLGNNIDTKG